MYHVPMLMQCQKTGPSRGPKNGAAKWTQLPQHNLELNWGGETATPKLGPFGDPSFGVVNSLFFYFWVQSRAFQTATLRRLWSTDKHSAWKDQLLRTTTSAGSFLVEAISMKKTCTVPWPRKRRRHLKLACWSRGTTPSRSTSTRLGGKNGGK